MEEIEQIALKTYELNMQYIQAKHSNLYKDLKELDLAIQNNQYQPQYDLEYIENNFDIREIATGKYIYNKNSKQISQSFAEYITLDKNNGSIESFGLFDINYDEADSQHVIRSRKYIYPMMKYSIESTTKDTKMKKIIKFIFSGVGLGLHIENIDKKIGAKRYLIIEDNIEIFKLSLFTTKYYKIAKDATIFFSVLEDIHTFTNTYNSFLEDAYMYNYLIKYMHLKSHSNIKLKHIASINSAQLFVRFSYQLQLDRFISPLVYLKKDYPLLDIYKDINQTVFKTKPLLVITSGPSLSKNIQWLKNNHNKFIILTVSSSLKYLYTNNITPDIVVSIDQQEHVKEFFSDYTENNYLKNTILLFSSSTNQNVLKYVNHDNLYIFDASIQFKSEKPTFSFSCVGSFAYLYSLSLKSDDIYLLGLDLAVDQETGNDHISDHIANTTTNINNKTDLSLDVSYTETLIPVEGNFDETVYTTPAFQDSIFTIGTHALNLKTNTQNVYNLNYGAKISAAQAMKISNIDVNSMPVIDKLEMHTLLKQALNKNNSKHLNKIEQEIMSHNKVVIQRIKKILIKYSDKTPSSNYDIYIAKLVKLSNDIYLSESNRLVKITTIYKEYFEYSLNITYNFFNTQDLKNVKQHILEFDRMIVDGLTGITKQFEEHIN